MFAIEKKEAFKKAVYRERAAKLSTFICFIDSKPDKFTTVRQPFVPRSQPSVKMIKQTERLKKPLSISAPQEGVRKDHQFCLNRASKE